jgi:hypothetical protein
MFRALFLACEVSQSLNRARYHPAIDSVDPVRSGNAAPAIRLLFCSVKYSIREPACFEMETGPAFAHIFIFFPHAAAGSQAHRLPAMRHRSASPRSKDWGESGGGRQRRLLLTRLKTGVSQDRKKPSLAFNHP